MQKSVGCYCIEACWVRDAMAEDVADIESLLVGKQCFQIENSIFGQRSRNGWVTQYLIKGFELESDSALLALDDGIAA
jgi:hypothetical protein